MERAGGRVVPLACRRGAAGVVVLVVVAIHLFRVGAHLEGPASRLYSSYASDVLLPLAMYFVLCLSERKPGFLADWKAMAAFVFAAASVAEVLQSLGVPMLGRTFDPLDFVMYAAGVLTAALWDRVILPLLCGIGSAGPAATR